MEVRNREAADPFTTADGSTIREFLHTASQSLAEATLRPGQHTERHHHRASEELYYLERGSGTMEIDGETREVGPGDAILIPRHAWHQLVASGGEELRFLCCCAPPYSHDDTFFA